MSWRRGGEGRPRPTEWPTSTWAWAGRAGPLCPKVCHHLTTYCSMFLLHMFKSIFFFLLFFFLQNKWDPVEKLILFTLQSVETNFHTFSHNLQKVLGSDVSSMLIGQCLWRTNHSTGQNCSEISS